MKITSSFRILILHTLLAALLALPTSCTEEEAVPGGGGSLPVAFRASVRPQTRLGGDAGNEWEAGDRIGVFKYRLENAAPTAESAAVNVPYNPVPGTSGKLSPVAGTYPIACLPDEEGTGFIAYYPYRADITRLGMYTINLSDQTAPSAIDLLYAKTPTDYDPAAKDPVVLEFTHQLAKLVLTVEAGDDIASLNDLTVSIRGMYTLGAFDLAAGSIHNVALEQNITPRYAGLNAEAARIYEALLLPAGALTEAHQAVFTTGGDDYTWDMHTSLAKLEAGHKYSCRITINQVLKELTVEVEDNPSLFVEIGYWQVPAVPEIEYALIPGGYFRMGSSDGSNQNSTDPDNEVNVVPAEPDRWGSNTEYQHWVLLTHDYLMSKYEITNAQFVYFLNANKVDITGLNQNGDDVVHYTGWSAGPIMYIPGSGPEGGTHDGTWVTTKGNVSALVPWCGAKAFAEWIGGDLPTEAEWERAARDGKEDLPFGLGNGKILNRDMANYTQYFNMVYDWDQQGIVSFPPHPNTPDTLYRPGYYKPSETYGLYDMHGNAREWCADTWWTLNVYPENDPQYISDIRKATTKDKAIVDPYYIITNQPHNRRGGGYNQEVDRCRSASRLQTNDTDYLHAVIPAGFRVVIRQSTCTNCY